MIQKRFQNVTHLESEKGYQNKLISGQKNYLIFSR